MLVRDKVGQEIARAIEEVDDSSCEVVRLNNDDFFEAIISKIKSEIDVLQGTKSIDSLAEIIELVDWIQVALGTTDMIDVIEHRAEKLGLYWQKYYIKNKEPEEND